MDNNDLKKMRIEFRNKVLSIADMQVNPIEQFKLWFSAATNAMVIEPNAFTLSTSTPEGQPSSRVVLLKSIEEDGIVFYTNYNSHKGLQIEANSKVAANFFWQKQHRQVRMEGWAKRVSLEMSNEYFNLRPLESRISAIASSQSQEIASREALEAAWEKAKEEAGDSPQRPADWGGYLIVPHKIEFWQGQENRLHDRFVYDKINGEENWEIKRLMP